eukprot:scaffold746_cov123-Cylindrotheca_fusiformis.AAC.24
MEANYKQQVTSMSVMSRGSSVVRKLTVAIRKRKNDWGWRTTRVGHGLECFFLLPEASATAVSSYFFFQAKLRLLVLRVFVIYQRTFTGCVA